MNKRGQTGFLLLEALIGLLIFAIGVLGLIGMQATAMKVTADSKYRAEATMYADQLVNQMWADGDPSRYLTGGAAYDEWANAVMATSSGLPGAEGLNKPTVEFDGSKYTIKIYWQAPGEATRHQYVAVVAQAN